MIALIYLGYVAATAQPMLHVALEPWCNDSIRVRVYPGHVNGMSAKPARIYFSSARHDTVLCISDACLHSESTSGYAPLALSAPEEGYAPQYVVPNISTTALVMYYSHIHRANLAR